MYLLKEFDGVGESAGASHCFVCLCTGGALGLNPVAIFLISEEEEVDHDRRQDRHTRDIDSLPQNPNKVGALSFDVRTPAVWFVADSNQTPGPGVFVC